MRLGREDCDGLGIVDSHLRGKAFTAAWRPPGADVGNWAMFDARQKA
jgi:hypothetical protein